MSMSRDAARAETRERLLDAAQAEFSDRRVVDVSLDEIAQRAGYTKGAIYSNFQSKTDLLFAVVERRMVDTGLDYINLIGDEPVGDLVDAVADRAQEVFDADIGYVRLLAALWADVVHDSESAAQFLHLQRSHRQRLADALEARSAALGITLSVDSSVLAAGLVALSLATMFDAAIDPEVSVGEVHRAVFSLLLAGALATGLPAD